MIRSRFARSFTLVLTMIVTISCSDYSPVGPAAPATAENGLLSGLLGTVLSVVNSLLGIVVRVIEPVSDPNGIPVYAVKWAGTHSNQVRTASATIGSSGGALIIPGSDFTITFPQGALSYPTTISVTSDGSGYVSYDMQPHGLRFNKPVIVTQSLKNTSVYGTPTALNAFGSYFSKDLLNLSGLLQALEIEKTTIYAPKAGAPPEVETWELRHFSRYMLASD
jgi:hypothetical protein